MSPAARTANAAALARQAFAVFEPEWIELAAIQPSAPYFDVLGEALRPRLISVETPDQEQLCLRFDMTVPAARAWAAKGAGEGALAYEGLVFRFNPKSGSRSSEHVQIGVELYGKPVETGVDADLVLAAWSAVREAGVKDARVILGDVGLFEGFVSALGVSPQNADRLLDQPPSADPARPVAQLSAQASALGKAFAALPRDEAERAVEEMLGFLKLGDVVGRDPRDILERLIAKREGAAAGLSEAARDLITRYRAIADDPARALDQIAMLAAEAGADLHGRLRLWSAWLGRLHDAGLDADALRFDADLGRGFSYYDGPVFEIEAPALGAEASLGGGGRYDALVGAMSDGAATAPAAGAVLRPERLAKAAEASS